MFRMEILIIRAAPLTRLTNVVRMFLVSIPTMHRRLSLPLLLNFLRCAFLKPAGYVCVLQARPTCQHHENQPVPVGGPLVARAPAAAAPPAAAATAACIARPGASADSGLRAITPESVLSPPAVSRPLEPSPHAGLPGTDAHVTQPSPADIPTQALVPQEPAAYCQAVIDLTGDDEEEEGVALTTASGISTWTAYPKPDTDVEQHGDANKLVCCVCGEEAPSHIAQQVCRGRYRPSCYKPACIRKLSCTPPALTTTLPWLQDWYACRHSATVCFCCSACSWKHTSAALQPCEPLISGKRPSGGPGVSCPVPGCHGRMADSSVAYFAPEEYNAWAERLSEAVLDTLQFIRWNMHIPTHELYHAVFAGLLPDSAPTAGAPTLLVVCRSNDCLPAACRRGCSQLGAQRLTALGRSWRLALLDWRCLGRQCCTSGSIGTSQLSTMIYSCGVRFSDGVCCFSHG